MTARKPCASCGHGKSKHRTRSCTQTQRVRGQTFMGIGYYTKWCECAGYKVKEESCS